MSDPISTESFDAGAQAIADATVIRDSVDAKIAALQQEKKDAETTIEQIQAQLSRSVQEVVDAKVSEAKSRAGVESKPDAPDFPGDKPPAAGSSSGLPEGKPEEPVTKPASVADAKGGPDRQPRPGGGGGSARRRFEKGAHTTK